MLSEEDGIHHSQFTIHHWMGVMTDPLTHGSDPPETIPIREGEDFDHARLAGYLKGHLPASDRPLEVVQFAGGHANLTYLLRYGSTEYVLRRPPVGPVA